MIEDLRTHLLNCQFSNWYSQYRKLTPKTRIIKPLPPAFIDFITSNGIHLESEVYDQYQISDTVAQIDSLIDELNGAVVPKLNWSAPKDAAWINTGNTLKCMSAEDVLLLLKSSDFVMHDIYYPFDDLTIQSEDDRNKNMNDKDHSNIQFELVLKEWFDLNPAFEFRCFVRERKLIGITQRNTNHFPYLDELSQEIKTIIYTFFETNLKCTFPDSDFVFDIYLQSQKSALYEKDNGALKCWLIDINPFIRRTDCVLYDWDELQGLDHSSLEIRLIPEGQINNISMTNRVPLDVIYASHGKNTIDFQKSFAEMIIENASQSKDINSDSDNDNDNDNNNSDKH